MEYIYAAMILHKAGKKINEQNLTHVLTAAGVDVDAVRAKALVASLDGVDIEEAIKSAQTMMATPTAPITDEKASETKPKEAEKPPIEPAGEEEVFSAEAMGYGEYEEPSYEEYEPTPPPEISPDDAAFLDEFMVGSDIGEAGPAYGIFISVSIFGLVSMYLIRRRRK